MSILAKDVLLVSQLFGTFPFCYAHENEKVLLKFSRKLFIWECAIFIFQTIAVFAALYLDYVGNLAGNPIQMNSNTAVVAVILDIGTLYIIALSTIVCSVTKASELLECHNILQKFDTAFKYHDHKSQMLRVLMVILYMACVLGFTSVVFISNGELRVYIPVMSINFSQAGLFLNFTHLCQAITDRFRALNDIMYIEIMKQRRSLVNKNSENCLSKMNYVTVGPSAAADLRVLADLYWLLCEAVHRANAFYCTQLLAAILSSFVHITITLYYFIAHSSMIVYASWLSYLTMEGMWVFTHTFYLLIVLRSSTAVADAADATTLLVCKLINKDLDYDLKSQLQSVLLQLLHHNARFSALGLFQIDSQIMTSIAGSVSTYLVILVQFQMQSQTPFGPMEYSSNSNNNCVA